VFPKLDIANKTSITDFAAEVKGHGHVDVLINNAGVNLDGEYSFENAKRTLDVNWRGTVDVSECLRPAAYAAYATDDRCDVS
jgi:carbonyl reductase 1